jgi:hypothetical protein
LNIFIFEHFLTKHFFNICAKRQKRKTDKKEKRNREKGISRVNYLNLGIHLGAACNPT